MRRLIALITTEGKPSEQITQEMRTAFQKYQAAEAKSSPPRQPVESTSSEKQATANTSAGFYFISNHRGVSDSQGQYDANKASEIVLSVPLGRDSSGRDHSESLLNLGHILIAGETGSGKSVFNHVLIYSLISRYSPTELKLFLSDPKRVEFRMTYKELPHLLLEVAEPVEAILGGLETIVQEKIKRLASNNNEVLPYIVVIIDTFSDVSYFDRVRFESIIKVLTSDRDKTRIHVVMCDSRVGEELFNENVKRCFPTRIAFKTFDTEGSQAIIGQPGAEKLKGKGDMLFLAPGAKNPIRLQGPFITDEEIKKNVDEIKPHNLGIPREEARNNIRKIFPDMSEEDVDALIDMTPEEFSRGCQNHILKQSKYARLYCTNCKAIYGHQSMGLIEKCNKCGQELIFKSFSPWPQYLIGLVIICIGGLTVLLGLPIIWIGGFLWGGRLIFNGFNQWNKIWVLDTKSR